MIFQARSRLLTSCGAVIAMLPDMQFQYTQLSMNGDELQTLRHLDFSRFSIMCYNVDTYCVQLRFAMLFKFFFIVSFRLLNIVIQVLIEQILKKSS